MPIYTYHCPRCKKTVDRKSSMADRDAPKKCQNGVPGGDQGAEVECEGDLIREEIAETANMKVNWAYWQVPFDDA